MRKCNITIKTTIDGGTNTVKLSGEARGDAAGADIVYMQEGGRTLIRAGSGKVTVDRTGDYRIFLLLEKGVRTKGGIGLGDETGEIDILTDRIDYSIKEDGIFLSLGYTLYFGGREPQTTRITLIAKYY